MGSLPSSDEVQALERITSSRETVSRELGKAIIGQQEVISQILMAFFSGGHCLLVGVPGLAKTLIIKSLAQVFDLSFKRIQFTPDLMPSDIIGTDVIEEDRASGRREMRFIKGPIFANIILADEVNRTPPKTQAALLEAMQEYHVTAGGIEYELKKPFFVLATQNPIEQEGTYPLPEAQLDRFMFNLVIDYPKEAEEVEIVSSTTASYDLKIDQVLSGDDVVKLHQIVRNVPASNNVIKYAVRLARASRPAEEKAPDFIKKWVHWGAGPRAGQYLILGSKARAILDGRFNASCEDVRAIAHSVLRHRIITNFHAEAEGIKPSDIIDRILQTVEEPKAEL